MLRIYDDRALQRRTRLKQTQVLAIFAAGIGCGLWLANADLGSALAAAPVAKAAAIVPPPSWCHNPASGNALHLDCELNSLRR